MPIMNICACDFEYQARVFMGAKVNASIYAPYTLYSSLVYTCTSIMTNDYKPESILKISLTYWQKALNLVTQIEQLVCDQNWKHS